MMRLQPLEQVGNDTAFQPALPTYGHEDRAMKLQRRQAASHLRTWGVGWPQVILQERMLVHVPEPAVADHGGEAIVVCYAARDKGRAGAVANQRDPVLVDIIPRAQIIHHVT